MVAAEVEAARFDLLLPGGLFVGAACTGGLETDLDLAPLRR